MRRLACLLMMLAGPPAAAQGTRIAAATPQALATAAAIQVLRAGGSAADAAIAGEMVLGVVMPQQTGIGGGGLALWYDAGARTVTSWDGLETAPAAASQSAVVAAAGGSSVGVPGLLTMLEALHREHGRLPWADLMTPAIRAAEQRTPPNAALADVLRTIAAAGASGLTRGPVAAEIATAVRSDTAAGLLTTDDLAAYAARRAPAACVGYRGQQVCGAGPPSTGSAALREALGLLERFDLGRLDPAGADAAMLIVEAEQLAAADAAQIVADPGFVTAPLLPLTAPVWLDERARRMHAAHAAQVDPDDVPQPPAAATVSLAVWDAAGNAVCLTTSLGGAAGSHLAVHGVVLNAALADFTPAGATGSPAAANRIEPGKRAATAMTPAMLLAADGSLLAVAGATGGSRLPGLLLQAITNLVDWQQDPAAAIAFPHRLALGGSALLEAAPDTETLAATLQARGEPVTIGPVPSGTVLITATPAGQRAFADPREAGVAASE